MAWTGCWCVWLFALMSLAWRRKRKMTTRERDVKVLLHGGFRVFIVFHWDISVNGLKWHIMKYAWEAGDDMLRNYSNTSIWTKNKFYHYRKKKKKSKAVKGIEIHENLKLSVKESGHNESSKKKGENIAREYRGAIHDTQTLTEDERGKVRINFVLLDHEMQKIRLIYGVVLLIGAWNYHREKKYWD